MREWISAIESIVVGAIDSGEVDVADLRTIVVAPAPGWQTLGVWLGTEWQDYPYPGDRDAAAGHISLAAWLDEVDAVARGEAIEPPAAGSFVPRGIGIAFVDDKRHAAWRAALARLHRDLVAACCAAASTTRLARYAWKHPVGIFATVSREAEAHVQAFCHPHGAPALPLAEQRKEHGYGSAYPWGSFHDDALVVFYPEGEGESFSKQSRATVQTYKLADVVRARMEDDEVFVRFRGEVFDVRFSPGHTHEESGGPDKAAVQCALREGFARVLDRAVTYQLPADGHALRTWLDGFAESHEKRNGFGELCKRYGAETMARLADSAELDAAVKGTVLHQLAHAYVEAGNPAAAVARLDAAVAIDKEHDSEYLRAKALLATGRFDDVVAIAKADGRNAEYRALALAALGRRDEAYAIVTSERMQSDSDGLAIHALLLAEDGKSTEAASKLADAFLEGGIQDVVLARVEQAPVLAPVVARWRTWQQRREQSREAIRALEPRVVDAPVWRDTNPISRVYGAPLADDGEDKHPNVRSARRIGGKVWAGDQEGAVVELIGDERKPIAKPFPGSRSIDAIETVPDGVLVTDKERLALLDSAGNVLATAQPIVRGDGALAVAEDLIALGCNDAIDFYRIAGNELRIVGTIATPAAHHYQGIAFAAPSIVCAAIDDAVYFIDLADPASPQPRSCLAIAGADEVVASGGIVFIKGNDHLWLVRCRDARDPQVIAKLRVDGMPTIARDGEHVWLARRGDIRVLDVQAGRFVEHWAVLGRDGDTFDEPVAIWRTGDKLAAVDGKGVVELAPLAAGFDAIDTQLAGETARVRELIAGAIQKWLSGSTPIGVIDAMWYAWGARIGCAAPASVPSLIGLEHDTSEELSFDSEEREDDEEGSDAEREQRSNLLRIAQEIAQSHRFVRLRELLREQVPVLAAATNAAKHVAIVATGRGDANEIVEVVATKGTALPARAQVDAKRTRTTLERLTADGWYREIDVMVSRAKRDAAFRDEVIELLATRGLQAAARIVHDLTLDPDLAARTWIAAADHNPGEAVAGLFALVGRPDARAKLESLAELTDPDVALVARRALGRLDEPAALELVRTLLRGRDGDGPYPGDIPENTLAAMSDASLEQLRPDLQRVFEKFASSHMDHVSNRLVLPLVRGGLTELPESVMKQVKQDISMEESVDEGLFGHAEPGEAITAIRHLITRGLVRRLAQPDDGGALWPEQFPVERYNVSWQRFFDIALPRLTQAGLLDELHARLAARISQNASDADRAFAKYLLLQDLLRGDARALDFGTALERGGYPERELAQIKHLAQLGRLQLGWSLLKEKRFTDARRLADAALADAPKDGQVHFFEARLAWLERDDPKAALERIPRALEIATDDTGRARLFNLYGAALDALGQVAESIPWFERALAADPSQAAMLLSNIAEAHWKLGNKDDALKFAKQASRRGSSTEIVGTILDAMGEEREEAASEWDDLLGDDEDDDSDDDDDDDDDEDDSDEDDSDEN